MDHIVDSTCKRPTRILITGASRGIGSAIACALACPGREIYVNYHQSQAGAQETCRSIAAQGGCAHALPFDVSNSKEVAQALAPFRKRDTTFDIVVHNAGIRQDALFGLMTARQWDDTIAVNLSSFYYVVKPILRAMVQLEWGRIIALASVAGLKGVAGQVNYCASKAGLIGACKALALELAPFNITVNAVAPGPVDTDMLTGLKKDEIIRKIPLGRLGLPHDIAAVVAFLCTHQADFITGQVISPNGGEW